MSDIPLQKLPDAAMDMLADILAWQHVIINNIAIEKANTKGTTPQKELDLLNEFKKQMRSNLIDELFVKYGPDLNI